MSSILDALLGRASPSEINAYGPGGGSYVPAYSALAQMSPSTLQRLTSTYSSPAAWLRSQNVDPNIISKVPSTWDAIVGPQGSLSQPTGVSPGPGIVSGPTTGGATTTSGGGTTTTGGGTVSPPTGSGMSTAPVTSIAPRQVGTWAPPTTPANYAGLVSQGRMGYVDPFQNYRSVATPALSGVNQTGIDITYRPMPKPTPTDTNPTRGPPTGPYDGGSFTQPGNVNSAGPGVRPPTGTGGTVTPPPTGTPPPPTVTTPPGNLTSGNQKVLKEQDGNPIDGTGGSVTTGTTTGGGSSNSSQSATDPLSWTIWKPNPGGTVDTPFNQRYGGERAPFSSLSDQIANAMAGFNVYSPMSWAQQGNPTFFQGRPSNLGPLGGTGNVMPFVR